MKGIGIVFKDFLIYFSIENSLKTSIQIILYKIKQFFSIFQIIYDKKRKFVTLYMFQKLEQKDHMFKIITWSD